MSAILKVRVPFYERRNGGGTDGTASFYLLTQPQYSPSVGQTVSITHTDVTTDMPLYGKLTSVSTNTVTGTYQGLVNNVDSASLAASDNYPFVMRLVYDSLDFSAYGGNCRGYIEYDVNGGYSVLKPVETPVIVSELVPFDLEEGLNTLTNKVTGSTYPTTFLKGMFVKRNEANSVFANLLKSLNIPVSNIEASKYTRSALGTLTIATGTTFDTVQNNVKYVWNKWTSTGATTTSLYVHPTTGYTGEYYNTVLQPIGSYEFNPSNRAALPVTNELYLIFEIPNSSYGEIIDGKSIKFRLPYYTGTTSGFTNKTFGMYNYGTTPQIIECYGTYNKSGFTRGLNLDTTLSETDLSVQDIGIRPDLSASGVTSYESNIVLLFSDKILTPQGNNITTWTSGYADLIDGVKVFNQTSGVEKATYDYYADDCIGYAVLDKGFIVITHPLIVDSYFAKVFNGAISVTGAWNTGIKSYDATGTLSTALSRGHVKTNPAQMITTTDSTSHVYWESSQFVFTGITGYSAMTSDVEFLSYNTEKSLNIVCLASSNEFFKSTNDTAKELLNVSAISDYANFNSGSSNLYPIIITGVGIHDANGNLLAVCKPTQPIQKYWYDIVSFNVKIRL